MTLGMTTLPCTETVEQVPRRVVAEIEARELEIVAVIDHNGDAADAGVDMPDSKLIVFRHPSGPAPLMLAHPEIGLDLPMKLLLWKRGDGAVFVTFNTAEFLSERHSLTAAETDVLRVTEAVAETVCRD